MSKLAATADSPIDLSNVSDSVRVQRWSRLLILGGILLRLLVLINASSFNADEHLGVIRWIAIHHALPKGDELSQSHHPPLYYVLMVPLWKMTGADTPGANAADDTAATARGIALLHLASFVMSCATLLILARTIYRHRHLFGPPVVRHITLAFVCVLPQFVMFCSFITNDTLTILLGAILFKQTIAFIQHPSLNRCIWVGVTCGLGLLTKGTFLFTGAALVPIVVVMMRRASPRRSALAVTAIFCLVWLALGCEKYVDNRIRVGRPIVHNMDEGLKWSAEQAGVWKGWSTIFDINVLKLIRDPILQPRHPFSYPLLMYGTFWYPHIPDSTFRASVRGYDWVGSVIYAVAIVPTLVFLIGLLTPLPRTRGRGWVRGLLVSRQEGKDPSPRLSPEYGGEKLVAWSAASLLLFSNLAVVLAAGIKFDAWSCFQSRLCFQSLGPAMLLFAIGMKRLWRWRLTRMIATATCIATLLACVLYFVIEIADANQLLPRQPERVSLNVPNTIFNLTDARKNYAGF